MTRRWTIRDVERTGLQTDLQAQPRPPAKYIFGIDIGVETGVAIWSRPEQKFEFIGTMMIHQAFEKVRKWVGMGILVRVEDARLRKWFGKAGREQLQGAGSIKRDAKAWEDFLKDYNIDYELVAPKDNMTKLDEEAFNRLTGWEKRTSVHGRDAAMLCFKF